MNRKSTSHFDVLIVGSGPAGASCAIPLARAGLRVVICDKERFPRDKICGECLNPASWQLLQELGVAGRLIESKPKIIDAIRITNKSGHELEVSLQQDARWPFIAIRRRVLDTVLYEQALREGVTTKQNALVRELAYDKNWLITVRDVSLGTTEVVSADYLVGADGRNSVVAQKLGRAYRRRPGGHRERGRVGLQWRIQAQPELENRVEMFLFDSGYCGLVNLDETEANLALVCKNEVAGLSKKDFKAFLAATICKNPRLQAMQAPIAPIGPIASASPINPKRRRLHHVHACLIGDARQTVEPFTGEGIYFAVQDALLAAERIKRLMLGNGQRRKMRVRKHTWANRLYSPILQRPKLGGPLVTLLGMAPAVTPWILRTVIRRS